MIFLGFLFLCFFLAGKVHENYNLSVGVDLGLTAMCMMLIPLGFGLEFVFWGAIFPEFMWGH